MFHRPNSSSTPTPSTSSPTPAENTSMTTTPSTPETTAESSDNRSVDIPAAGGNPFQRSAPAAAAPARPSVPAYGAGNYPSYGTPVASSSTGSSGRRLVIGEGITMSGEIESCDHLVVEGTVEAALKGANILEIAEKGMFYGTVEIAEATIAGKFEGDITCSGRLTIRAGGSVIGAITYKELAVEAGATIDGKITPVGGSSKGATSGKKSPNGKASANTTEELPMLQRAAG